MLLLPASNAITGVIQQSEAAIAVRTPAPVNVPEDFEDLVNHISMIKSGTQYYIPISSKDTER